MSARARLQAAWDRLRPLEPRTVFYRRAYPPGGGPSTLGWWARCAVGSVVYLGRYSAPALADLECEARERAEDTGP